MLLQSQDLLSGHQTAAVTGSITQPQVDMAKWQVVCAGGAGALAASGARADQPGEVFCQWPARRFNWIPI